MTTVRAWRLVQRKWAATAFSGEGARRYPGRWNHRGTPMVYTSSHRALAALEALVHFDVASAPPHLVLVPVDLPTAQIRALPADELPSDWKSLPAPDSTRTLGTWWCHQGAVPDTDESLVLEVPSVVLEAESNFLINPMHPAIDTLRVGDPEPFAFDPRLLP